MRLELAGVFLGAFYSVFAAKSPVRVFSGLLRNNHNNSPILPGQVLHVVFDDARFEVRITRAHSEQDYTVVRHHILACLENETVPKLSKFENHFERTGFFWMNKVVAPSSTARQTLCGKQVFPMQLLLSRAIRNWPIVARSGAGMIAKTLLLKFEIPLNNFVK
jgi:hypothetical protein